MEATKDHPAPLDAFESAKPNEPIWTVQGGDPLGAPLLRIWAVFARIQAGVITANCTNGVFEQILRAANNNPPANEREEEALLVRATATEEISWSFDRYLKHGAVSKGEEKEDRTFDEFARLDIYDIRRRTASRISNFFSELHDYREQLKKHNWLDEELDNQIEGTICALKSIEAKIKIGRER